MERTPCCDISGLKKGTWTPEEDRKLVAYVTRYGCWNWRQLPKFAGLARCGKSCRLRWMNYLRPDVKRGNYTQQEEDIIIRLHQKLGNRWSKIAASLPGRTDNEIKNHWHTNLKKRFQVHHQKSDKKGKAQALIKPKNDNIATQVSESTQETSSIITTVTDPSQCASVESNAVTFPMSSTDTDASSNNENLVEEHYADLTTLVDPFIENFWTEPYMVDIDYDDVVLQNEPLLFEPFSDELPQYFDPVSACNAQLWGNNHNLLEEYIGLF